MDLAIFSFKLVWFPDKKLWEFWTFCDMSKHVFGININSQVFPLRIASISQCFSLHPPGSLPPELLMSWVFFLSTHSTDGRGVSTYYLLCDHRPLHPQETSEFILKWKFIFFNLFYWSTVDLQCCVSFRCTASGVQIQLYIYIYIFFFIFFSIMVYYRLLNIVPCAIQ